jgi:hypothetical protein
VQQRNPAGRPAVQYDPIRRLAGTADHPAPFRDHQRTGSGAELRWVGEEVQREAIAQEFKAVLEDKIGKATKLSLGSFSSL